MQKDLGAVACVPRIFCFLKHHPTRQAPNAISSYNQIKVLWSHTNTAPALLALQMCFCRNVAPHSNSAVFRCNMVQLREGRPRRPPLQAGAKSAQDKLSGKCLKEEGEEEGQEEVIG